MAKALRLTTVLLGCFCGGIILSRTGVLGPLATLAYVFALGAVILVVFELRTTLLEFYRDLQSGERLGLAILCAALFFVPSFVFRTWAPLTGLAILYFPLALGLVNPPGYARFYMLCGISVSLAAARLQPDRSIPILLAFLVLLVACLAVEAWFFSLMSRERRAPGTRRPLARLEDIAILTGNRFIVALLVTLPMAGILSTLRLETPSFRPDRPLPRLAQSLEMDLSLLQFLLQSVVIMLGAISLALLYRWLESRRPRHSQEGETLGTALIESMEVMDAAPRPTRQRRAKLGPRESILAVYSKLNQRLERYDLSRQPAQTIHQWVQSPGNPLPTSQEIGKTPPPPADTEDTGNQPAQWPQDSIRDIALTIAAMATLARYTPDEPSWDQVREFDRLCTNLLKALRSAQSP